MATLPQYLQAGQDDQTIRARMLTRVGHDLDKSEGSYIWDAIAPAALELAQLAVYCREVLDLGFAQTSRGDYLTRRAEEHGVVRKAATKATVTLSFTGTDGTVVPVGAEFATASTDSTPAIRFVTTKAATIASGVATATAEAKDAGSRGNVVAGSIVFRISSVPGLTSVTNGAAATGGTDRETDAALLERYLIKVRNPSAGGNKADYVNWALAVPGVGGVSVVPVRDGPGTVSVAILATDKTAPNQALIDAVQDAIAPPHRLGPYEAETFALSGFGVSVDTNQADDVGSSLQFVYHGSGHGTGTQADIDDLLPHPGIYTARVRAKVDTATGSAVLFRVGIWDRTTATWAKTTPGGSVDAYTDYTAAQLSTAFAEYVQQFYCDGIVALDLQVERRTTDTARTVWVDQVRYVSAFSRVDGEGKAPVGARVSVEAPTTVGITVVATLTITPGYTGSVVRAAAEQAIRDYIKSLAFAGDNDVRYSRIANAILDTPGVTDYSGLTVNGGTANIAIGVQALAIISAVTLN